jgi:metallo-beta-lactamase family protein
LPKSILQLFIYEGDSMKLTFLGGAQTVTGSKYLVETKHHQLLIDCGLFQGLKSLRLKNWDALPIAPSALDAVLLTHAHIDHSGYIPLLVKNGFKGRIYCTQATFDLCKILLPDSGHLHEEDARRANKYHYSKHVPALPLYTQLDAELCLKQFCPIAFDEINPISTEVNVQWQRAGHILGASIINVFAEQQHLIFSGDLGRTQDPIMCEPHQPTSCDTLIIESTYGNRLHTHENPYQILAETINHTAKNGGTILIPAFAVGRTQSLMYYLYQLKQQKKIPNLPIYLDSPMAINATHILQSHYHDHRLSPEQCRLICDSVTYVNSREESQALDEQKYSKIIISASGMITGGRILHHVKQYGPDEKSTIILTGFQAHGTRGARLLEQEKQLKIHGEMVPIRAQVISLSSTSAHADYQEILDWLSGFKTLPKNIFITHGELDAARALKTHIFKRFHIEAIIPSLFESFELYKK